MAESRPFQALSRPAMAALGAALLLTLAVPLQGQQVELRRKFQSGNDYLHRQVQTSRTATPAGDVNQTLTILLRETVLSVAPDRTASVRVTYESVQLVQDGVMGRREYDSRAGGPKPTDPLMAIMAALAGRSFEIAVGADGRPVSTTGLDTFRDEVIAAVATDNPQLAARMGEALSASELNELTGMTDHGLESFPTDPVSPGSDWTGDTSVASAMGTTRVQHTYTLREVDTVGGRQVANIDVRGAVASEMDPSSPVAALVSGMTGDVTGEMQFDVGRGVVLRSTLTTVVSMQLMGETLRSESTYLVELVP